MCLVLVAAIAAGGTWLLAGGGDDPASTTGEPVAASAPEEEDVPSWLFSTSASGGTFATAEDGTHTLTLAEVSPNITAFTDRPDRDTAIIPVDLLVSSWDQVFADSPPNAVLVEHDPIGDTDSFVVTLSNPNLDGTTLSFTATIVEGKDHSAQIPGLTPAPYAEPPAEFDGVSLFIDDVAAGEVLGCAKSSGDLQLLTPPGTIPYPSSAPSVAAFEKSCDSVNGVVMLYGSNL